jgi:hypothetical protein
VGVVHYFFVAEVMVLETTPSDRSDVSPLLFFWMGFDGVGLYFVVVRDQQVDLLCTVLLVQLSFS